VLDYSKCQKTLAIERTLKSKIQLSQSVHKEKRVEVENIRSSTRPGNTHHTS